MLDKKIIWVMDSIVQVNPSSPINLDNCKFAYNRSTIFSDDFSVCAKTLNHFFVEDDVRIYNLISIKQSNHSDWDSKMDRFFNTKALIRDTAVNRSHSIGTFISDTFLILCDNYELKRFFPNLTKVINKHQTL